VQSEPSDEFSLTTELFGLINSVLSMLMGGKATIVEMTVLCQEPEIGVPWLLGHMILGLLDVP
jgi:hypothetical protein